MTTMLPAHRRIRGEVLSQGVLQVGGEPMQTDMKVVSGHEPPRPQPPASPQVERRAGPSVAASAPATGAPGPVPAREQEEARPNVEAIELATKRMNDHFRAINNNNLEFSIDEELERTIVKVVDRETGDTVRQIPPEEILALARHLAALDDEGPGVGPLLIETKT